MTTEDYDIIVIGGGFAGLAIAYHLARRQVAVLLLEAGSLGSGSSGACAGRAQVSEGHRGRHMDLALAGLARLEGLQEELGFDFEWRRLGNLMLIEHERHWQWWSEQIAYLQQRGFPAAMLNPTELAEAEPLLAARPFSRCCLVSGRTSQSLQVHAGLCPSRPPPRRHHSPTYNGHRFCTNQRARGRGGDGRRLLFRRRGHRHRQSVDRRAFTESWSRYSRAVHPCGSRHQRAVGNFSALTLLARKRVRFRFVEAVDFATCNPPFVTNNDNFLSISAR